MTHREQDGPEPVVSEGGLLSSNRGKLLIALVVLIGGVRVPGVHGVPGVRPFTTIPLVSSGSWDRPRREEWCE